MKTLEELTEECYKKLTAMWAASDLASKYNDEYLEAQQDYQRASEERDKEWRKTNAS